MHVYIYIYIYLYVHVERDVYRFLYVLYVAVEVLCWGSQTRRDVRYGCLVANCPSAASGARRGRGGSNPGPHLEFPVVRGGKLLLYHSCLNFIVSVSLYSYCLLLHF